MKKLAVFDVDGTIFRSSLLIEMVEELVRRDIFPAKSLLQYAKERTRWIDRKGSYEDYIEAVVRVFMDNIKGVHISEFEGVADTVFNAQKDRVYKFTRDLLKKLKKQNYFLLAVSQSPKTILDKFCKRLGFHKVYGRFYEIGSTDRFTGTVVDLHLIGNKANIIKRVVEKEKVTLKGSVGVGDTEGDISFLELVEKPIAFNPNGTLFRHAKLEGWSIVVERKDVIYTIQ